MSLPGLEAVRALAPVPDAWLVGGSVRDLMLGRAVVDVDLVVADDPAAAARGLARTCGGAPFPLSDRHAERLARRDAHLAARPSGERVLTEIRRLLEPDHPEQGLRLLDRLGVLDVVLPEAVAMRGVGQSQFHHLDVFDHTLKVLDAAADVSAHVDYYLRDAAVPVQAALDAEVGNDFTGHT